MTSGNRSDVKEDAYRYVGVTDIQKECRILYLACAVLHAVMALCFMKLEINIMLYESAAAAVFYLSERLEYAIPDIQEDGSLCLSLRFFSMLCWVSLCLAGDMDIYYTE